MEEPFGGSYRKFWKNTKTIENIKRTKTDVYSIILLLFATIKKYGKY